VGCSLRLLSLGRRRCRSDTGVRSGAGEAGTRRDHRHFYWCGLGGLDAKLEQIAMNARRAPQRIGKARKITIAVDGLPGVPPAVDDRHTLDERRIDMRRWAVG
jgi:hypothetical protein